MNLKSMYRKANPSCEYCPYLGNQHVKWHPRGDGLELDHIWGKISKKYCECISNYAMACPTCHDEKTGNMSCEARIAITWHKLQKNEFDIDELYDCRGFHVAGWVATVLENRELASPFKEMAQQIVEDCDD